MRIKVVLDGVDDGVVEYVDYWKLRKGERCFYYGLEYEVEKVKHDGPKNYGKVHLKSVPFRRLGI